MSDAKYLSKPLLKSSFSKGEAVKIIFPSLLAVLLFVVALFGLLLPALEENLMQQKKTMISMLTQTSWALLSSYEDRVLAGELSRGEAQEAAIRQVRSIRYGAEGKDYFWINDLHPKVIMHPYRPDLEGRDVTAFADPGGTFLFNEMVEVVRWSGSGYVPYMWQWKDDPDRIVPKLSYVKLFEPWGWIIGTGVYVGDVELEISAITRKLALVSVGILAVMVLLSIYIIRKGLHEMKGRCAAELELRQYHDHLEEMVEVRTMELQEALTEVKKLSGFLPICAACKKIRDDQGYWKQVETYIEEHSEAEFSHSICPDCTESLYGFSENDESL